MSMNSEINMLKQVRKALNDIAASLTANNTRKAGYQIFLLRQMIDDGRVAHPWSHYQPRVDEEFET